MFSLENLLGAEQGNAAVEQISQTTGLNPSSTNSVIQTALPAILITVVPAVSDVNPANADVAVSLDIRLIDFNSAGDFLAFTDAIFSFVIRGLLRFDRRVVSEVGFRNIVSFGLLSLFGDRGY